MDYLSKLTELNGAHVRIKDPDYVNKVISNMIKMGKIRLQVVSDFDHTISLTTTPFSNDLPQISNFLTQDQKKQFLDWYEYYDPINNDHEMSIEEKAPYIKDWWEKINNQLVECKITRDELKACVERSDTHMRRDCKQFFEQLEDHDIPLLIFSAGLGDVIHEWIDHECGRAYKNAEIVSNFMIFDEKTKTVIGFKEPLIHIFNKNQSALIGTDYEKKIENRPNILLLGDSLGDVEMAGRYKNIQNLLKIGFLDMKKNELLPAYMKEYDIVLINDNTFNVPNAIIKIIVQDF